MSIVFVFMGFEPAIELNSNNIISPVNTLRRFVLDDSCSRV